MAQLLGDCVYPTKESQGRLCVKTPAGSYSSCKVTRRAYLGILAKCKNIHFLVGQIPPANPISSFPYLVQSTKLLACQNLNLVSEYFLQFIFGFSVLCTRNPNTSVWVQNLFLSSGDCQEDGCFPDNFDVTTGQNSEKPRL